MTGDQLEPVRVLHRTGQWCEGVRAGDVATYEVAILPPWQVEGRPTVDRCHLLLAEGVQLTQPVVFTGALEGGWYVDLVRVEEAADGLIVHDLWVDVLILPAGRHYEVLDLDELADAMESGAIDPAAAATVLRNTQRFIDRHLRDDTAGPDDPWPDFPPRVLEVLVRADDPSGPCP